MNTESRRKTAKLLALGMLLAACGLNAHAIGAGEQGQMTGEVVGQALASRHIVVENYTTKATRFRVALSAKITLLNGAKGALEDVLLGDEVLVKLDSKTGDIRDLSVIAQH